MAKLRNSDKVIQTKVVSIESPVSRVEFVVRSVDNLKMARHKIVNQFENVYC